MKKRFIRHGFNMVEVALALAIIAIGISSILVLFPVGANANKAAIANNNLADIAEYMMSYIRAGVTSEWIANAERSEGAPENNFFTDNIKKRTSGNALWPIYSPATLARSLAAMGSDASRNTSIIAEHTRHTIQVLAKEPVASNSTPETMAPTVPPTISSEVMVPVTLPRSAMPNCLDAAIVGVGDVVLRKGNAQVADDQRLEQAHAVDENRVARGHDHEARGHHEPAGEELTLLGHAAPYLTNE